MHQRLKIELPQKKWTDITNLINQKIKVDEGVAIITILSPTGAVVVADGSHPENLVDLNNEMENLLPSKLNYDEIVDSNYSTISSLLSPTAEIMIEDRKLHIGSKNVYVCEFSENKELRIAISQLG